MNLVDSLLEKLFSLRPVQEKLETKYLGRPTPGCNLTQTVKSENRLFCSTEFSGETFIKNIIIGCVVIP